MRRGWAGLLGVLAALVFGAFAVSAAQRADAQGGYTGAYFSPATDTATYTGTETDGTPVTFALQLDVAQLTDSEIAGQGSAPPGEAYFDIEIGGGAQSVGPPEFLPDSGIPTSDLSLSTPQGTFAVNDTAANPFGQNLFAYDTYFLVPDNITSATLEIAAAKNVGGLEKTTGEYVYVSFSALAIHYTIETTSSTSSSGSATPKATQTSVAAPAGRGATSNGTLALELAGTAGGVTLLVFFLPVLINRRAYARAASEGTVVIGAPPAPVPEPPAPAPSEAEPAQRRPSEYPAKVLVRLFGEHDEVEGLREPIGQGPRELLDYLAAHPGTEASSARMRAAIWRDPRPEITSKTFDNYLSSLRKALPPDALARSDRGRQHRLTGAVQSDWGLVRAYVEDGSGDRASSLTEALKLVRGRPFAWAESAGNGAYSWALAGLASSMERAVEDAAHELVGLCLEGGDLATARFAVEAGLRGTSFSETLEEDALRVAAAEGGAGALRKAMAEARARLGYDAQRLEAFATELGWSE